MPKRLKPVAVALMLPVSVLAVAAADAASRVDVESLCVLPEDGWNYDRGFWFDERGELVGWALAEDDCIAPF